MRRRQEMPRSRRSSGRAPCSTTPQPSRASTLPRATKRSSRSASGTGRQYLIRQHADKCLGSASQPAPLWKCSNMHQRRLLCDLLAALNDLDPAKGRESSISDIPLQIVCLQENEGSSLAQAKPEEQPTRTKGIALRTLSLQQVLRLAPVRGQVCRLHADSCNKVF